jgi:Tfp pilus assembly protein PilW
MRSAVRKRVVYEEAGFTLTEMLVTTMIMIIVLFALYSVFDMGIRVFSFGNDKVEATENARLGMEKMEREIRAAYPVDRVNGRDHVFFSQADSLDPATSDPTLPGEQSITFGNDVAPPNRKIDPEEAITYELDDNEDGLTCCAVYKKRSSGDFEPLVESVVADGLTFEYLRNNMEPATVAEGTDIGVVRITLEVSVDGVEQTLTTDVDLRNRGG